MTHAELVERAARWLRNSAVVDGGYNNPNSGEPWRLRARCSVVFTEHASSCGEFPDAIGWFGGGKWSVLVEAKTTVGDFLGDRRKPFRRRPQDGVGRYRYYFTQSGLLTLDQLPEHWGLAECWPRQVRIRRLAALQPEYSARREAMMLFAALRRLQGGYRP
jgi:hypothetical protein